VLRDVTEHHRALRSLRQADEQRRSLLERVVTSQEEERRQVAGDIHDDAIQAMVAVTLQLQALGGRLHDPRSTELIERLAATATESVGRLRQLVFELRPPLLDEVGLAAAIDQYARRAGELAGFVVQVSDESAGELPDELRVVAYRIVQEALANVRAHANARRVAVRLEEVDAGVLARVSDDGVGFLPGLVGRRPAGHLGLISMREQATMTGGWCRIASAPGMGTTVELWLPRPKGEGGKATAPDRGRGGGWGRGGSGGRRDAVGGTARKLHRGTNGSPLHAAPEPNPGRRLVGTSGGPSGGRSPPHVELSQRVEEVVIGLEDLPLASPCLLGRLALSSLPLRRPEPRRSGQEYRVVTAYAAAPPAPAAPSHGRGRGDVDNRRPARPEPVTLPVGAPSHAGGWRKPACRVWGGRGRSPRKFP